MSWNYPKERKLTKNDVESYAQACWEILCELGLSDTSKIYDPLTIQGKTAHSYIFDLRDGGRHHSFKNLEELKNDILEETINLIKEPEINPKPTKKDVDKMVELINNNRGVKR